jgi:pimeloyl-ACP methyl ester carboxylesterase
MPEARHAGARIHYEVCGSGPALVFAHGAGGNTLSWWQQVPHFASRHTVVTFDHRCFGRSACAAPDFHPRHFAGDLRAVLDAAGVERAALVCQSLGGWTGVRAALAFPERVRALVLAGTPGGIVTPGVLRAMAAMGTRLAREGVRGSAALAPDFPQREPARAFLYDQISAQNTSLDPSVLARLLDPDARVAPAELAGWRTPTLLLAGEQDQLFPLPVLREVRGLLPGAAFTSFAGAGHSLYFELPGEFNRAVDAFLATTT